MGKFEGPQIELLNWTPPVVLDFAHARRRIDRLPNLKESAVGWWTWSWKSGLAFDSTAVSWAFGESLTVLLPGLGGLMCLDESGTQ